MSDPREILDAVGHRPFPPSSDPWVMFQSWRRLLFAHWPLPPEQLRPLVPQPLELETFEGEAWVGLTPFDLHGLRARFTPAVPGPSQFPELNLRTYVRLGDRPGIFFFTLEAGSDLAVAGARIFYRLPYHRASMEIREEDGWFHYRSERKGGGASFKGRYRPVGDVSEAARGTLEYFLTERYALYAVLRDGGVLRGDIHHRPWPLQPAEAEIEVNTVPGAHGIKLPDREPLLHYSARQDTLIWAPKAVR